MQAQDLSPLLQQQVQQAYQQKIPLCISGANTKHWYGGLPQGQALSLAKHSGIVSYDPTELVITARAGTPLVEIEAALAEHQQHLAFEPPHFGTAASLGGTIAANFSGPARPYWGSARDFVLGCQLINGKGEILKFGGQVMKNVAGYDVSRLMTGSLGTLGILLEISLKVLPKPTTELTLVQELAPENALQQLQQASLKPYPISAACWYNGHFYLRLSGSQGAVKQASKELKGDLLDDTATFWKSLREHRLSFFKPQLPLWRLSLPLDAPLLKLEGDCLYDWGGAQRWLHSEATAEDIRVVVSSAGGSATLFRSPSDQLHRAGLVFHPLEAGLLRYHRALKQSFDPAGICNPQRLYPEF
ncbi:MAG: glycolate oxidase subunit GlcE [Proteobacteria bacterium]|nr:MAG: glycolate oxidase subunit GlcE [Pseudomonadota bacterium]